MQQQIGSRRRGTTKKKPKKQNKTKEERKESPYRYLIARGRSQWRAMRSCDFGVGFLQECQKKKKRKERKTSALLLFLWVFGGSRPPAMSDREDEGSTRRWGRDPPVREPTAEQWRR